jgi:hypothetical protein
VAVLSQAAALPQAERATAMLQTASMRSTVDAAVTRRIQARPSGLAGKAARPCASQTGRWMPTGAFLPAMSLLACQGLAEGWAVKACLVPAMASGIESGLACAL